MISARAWRAAFAATAILSAVGSRAQIPDDEKREQAFIAEAARRLRPGEAPDALRAGPAEEYYTWGTEICSELANGTRDEAIIGNLVEFFGKELATALVGVRERSSARALVSWRSERAEKKCLRAGKSDEGTFPTMSIVTDAAEQKAAVPAILRHFPPTRATMN